MEPEPRRSMVIALLCGSMFIAGIGAALPVRADQIEPRYERRDGARGYNDEYIFAATYGLTRMRVPAALKVPLVPVTLVMDVALLPFEVIAGCF